MTFYRIVAVFCMVVVQLLAQVKELTVNDLYNDPGLNSKRYLEKGFTWSKDGRHIYYMDTVDDEETIVRLNVRSKKTDTIALLSEFVLIEDGDTLQFNLNPVLMSNDDSSIMFTHADDFYLYDLTVKKFSRITDDGAEKSDLKFSPDNKFISYIKDNDIHITNIETKESEQLTKGGSKFIFNGKLDWVYPEELDIQDGYQWSSDSRRIAFLQMDQSNVPQFPIPDLTAAHPEVYMEFYPKAGDPNPNVRVGIVSISDKKNVWFDFPDTDMEYITRFDWLPNRDTLAIQTLNRGQNHLCMYFADPETGNSTLIMEEKDSYWLNLTDMYYFFKESDRFIWYSERDGYTHLYMYNYKGDVIRQLTKGEWCVTDFNGVDEKKDIVYYTANRQSPIERHIFSSDLKSGSVKLIGKNYHGSSTAEFSPLFNYYIEYFTNYDIPTRAYLTTAKGKRVKILFKNEDFNREKYGFGKVKNVELTADDGAKLYGSLLLPRDFNKNRKYPVLVYVYGGPHAQIVQNRFVRTWHRLLNQKGYIVFSLDNRGSFARGRDWERKIYLQLGKYELADQLVGIEYLKSLDYIDADRIGIWGWSYGGYMTLLALSKAPEEFKTGVVVAPVTHWKYYDSIYTERYMRLPNENQDGYEEASPINYVQQIEDYFFLAHGLGDDNVHFQNSSSFIDELIKYNKKFQLMVYPGRKHSIRDDSARIHLFETITTFLEENL